MPRRRRAVRRRKPHALENHRRKLDHRTFGGRSVVRALARRPRRPCLQYFAAQGGRRAHARCRQHEARARCRSRRKVAGHHSERKIEPRDLQAGTVSARQEEATEYSNRLLSSAATNPVFDQMTPTLVAVVDANGVSLGRNGTNLGRGEDMASGHTSLKAALAQGVTATDVWADARSSQLMSVSYAPVRDDAGKVLGALLVGTPLTDGRLQRTAELTSGRGLILGIPSGQNIDLKAKSSSVSPAILSAVSQSPLKEELARTVTTGHGAFLPG